MKIFDKVKHPKYGVVEIIHHQKRYAIIRDGTGHTQVVKLEDLKPKRFTYAYK